MSAAKLWDLIKRGTAVSPSCITATGTYVMNAAAGAAASGIDTQGYDEALVLLNVGDVVSGATLDVTVLENSSDTSSGASAISGATFTQVDSNTDARMGSIVVKKTQRYIFPQVVKAGTAVSSVLGIETLLYKGRAPTATHTAGDFDI